MRASRVTTPVLLWVVASCVGCSSSSSGQGWPTADPVVAVDEVNQFPENVSGLAYEASPAGDRLWAVRNQLGAIFRLTFDGATWNANGDDVWGTGRLLRFPNGSGDPDAEGITLAEVDSPAVYVSVERENFASVPRLSVLRFDTSATGSTLVATHEWNLTGDLPPAPENLGLEGIAWIPDAFLVGNGLFDENAGARYDPARYPDHGTGLFLVGMEANGLVLAYALDHVSAGFHRVASFGTGQNAVMDLAFDRDVGVLWAYCDVTCGNRATVLALGASGHFEIQHVFDAPATLPSSENEGIAIAPESTCVEGRKGFFWADDAATGGHAIRRGTIPCGPLP